MIDIIPIDWIIGALAALASGAAIWFTGRKSGKDVAKIENMKSAIKAHEVRNEVENRIATERDARERLRDKWMRGL